MITPNWALTLSFWLHMLATVIWIGGLALLSWIVIPIGLRSLSSQDYAKLLEEVQRRLDRIGWLSLAVLAVTGLIQMSANPNYQGFLAIENRWAMAILLKHIVFAGMIAVSAALTWGVLPALRRAALRRAKGLDNGGEDIQRRREILLVRFNLILSLLALALTALARTA